MTELATKVAKLPADMCTCGKKIEYIKGKKPNGRMGVFILHDGEPMPDGAVVADVSTEYKLWLRDRMVHDGDIVVLVATPESSDEVSITVIAKGEEKKRKAKKRESEKEKTVQYITNNPVVISQEVVPVAVPVEEVPETVAGSYSVVSNFLNGDYELLDDAMAEILIKVPEASFSFWNDDAEKTWLDIYESDANKNIIGKIYEG